MLLADSFCNETWIQISTRMMISDLMVSRCVGIWWLRLQDEGLPALQLTAQDILAGRRVVGGYSWFTDPGALQSFSMWYVETRQAPRWTGRLFFGSKSFRLKIRARSGRPWLDHACNFLMRIPALFPRSGTVQKPIDCFNFWLAVLWVQQLGPWSHFCCLKGVHWEGLAVCSA